MSARISLHVDSNNVNMSPGGEGRVRITLTNEGDTVDSFSISVVGLDSTWYTFPSPGPVKLFPETSSDVELRVHPPKEASAVAGAYPFSVVATSQDNPQERAEARMMLNVAAVGELGIEMEPRRVVGRKGLYTVALSNPGNAPRTVILEATDAEEALRYSLGASSVQAGKLNVRYLARPNNLGSVVAQGDGRVEHEMEVPPGSVGLVPLLVSPRKAVKIGRERLFRFDVGAHPPGVGWEPSELRQVTGELVYRPRFAAWVGLPALVRRVVSFGLMLLIIGSLVFLFLQLQNRNTPANPSSEDATRTAVALSTSNAGGTTTTAISQPTSGIIDGGTTITAGVAQTTASAPTTAPFSLLQTLEDPSGGFATVAFSPDGQMLASGSKDGTVKLWRSSDGLLMHTSDGHTAEVLGVAFAPDGQLLASGSSDNTINLWRLPDGPLIRAFKGVTSFVGRIAFSPDGQILAAGGAANIVRLWNVADGTPLRTLDGPGQAMDVAFSPDGQILAAGWAGNTVSLWHVSDGTSVVTLKTNDYNNFMLAVAFSPDGQMLASGSGYGEKEVQIWRLPSGTLIRALDPPDHIGHVWSVAFSPDGQVLASGQEGSGDSDATVKLWHVSDGSLLHTLKGPSVYTVAFSPDGQMLASASGDGTVRLWWLGREVTADVAVSTPIISLPTNTRPSAASATTEPTMIPAATPTSFSISDQSGSSIVGKWILSSEDLDNTFMADTGVYINGMKPGETLEFRSDGMLRYRSNIYKYKWEVSSLQVDYPFQPIVYDASLSSDGSTLTLKEQVSTHIFTFVFRRQR